MISTAFLLLLVGQPTTTTPNPAEVAVRKAVTLYASFDDSLRADVGGGELTFSTRTTVPMTKNEFKFEKGADEKVFRIGKGMGVAGGALMPADVLPNNGRIFLPAKGNIAFKKGGWSGSTSVWIDTDPNTLLKTTFCDPIQITQKGANNGGIWFDFNNAKPRRDLRMGVFPAVPEGKKGLGEDAADAPMVKVAGPVMKVGQWRHVAMVWSNFDSGKADARAALYIDGKLMGEVKERAIAMDWDIEKTGIYVAISYIGLLDELAVFNRALTEEEVRLLHARPGVLQGLKK